MRNRPPLSSSLLDGNSTIFQPAVTVNHNNQTSFLSSQQSQQQQQQQPSNYLNLSSLTNGPLQPLSSLSTPAPTNTNPSSTYTTDRLQGIYPSQPVDRQFNTDYKV